MDSSVWRLLLVTVWMVQTLCTSEAEGKCSTPWKDCGSSALMVHSVEVSGCCTSPCVLVKGTNTTVAFTFTPMETMGYMIQKLCVEVTEDYCVPVDLPSSDACKYVPCPLLAGTKYIFNSTFLIQASYPTVQTNIEWQLFNSDEPIGCIQLEIVTAIGANSKNPKYTPECKPPAVAARRSTTAGEIIHTAGDVQPVRSD